MSKHYAYSFTWFSYPEDYELRLHKQRYHYMCWGNELCPTTGRRHLQGYIRYVSQRSMRAVKKDLPGIHLEVSEGTADQNRTYCSKEGDFYEYGVLPKKGERTDLTNIRRFLDTNIRDLLQQGYIQNSQQLKFAEGLQKYRTMPKDDPIQFLWFYGPSGSGKTRYAMTYPDVYIADLVTRHNVWMDGYTDHETILFDDYRRDTLPFEQLLHITDRYPVKLPVKGSMCHRACNTIIITCPVHPKQLFDFTDYDWEDPDHEAWQLHRRLTKIKSFPSIDGIPPEQLSSPAPETRHPQTFPYVQEDDENIKGSYSA